MKECCDCDWFTSLINSDGVTVYICLDTSSGAYFEETGHCGNCGLLDSD
jgi:hypothetical protein